VCAAFVDLGFCKTKTTSGRCNCVLTKINPLERETSEPQHRIDFIYQTIVEFERAVRAIPKLDRIVQWAFHEILSLTSSGSISEVTLNLEQGFFPGFMAPSDEWT